ncbi:MAG: hypothetical protein RJB66_1824 [Pseudomonadota bacterium]|jgi:peroxiredoxin Q/BCP
MAAKKTVKKAKTVTKKAPSKVAPKVAKSVVKKKAPAKVVEGTESLLGKALSGLSLPMTGGKTFNIKDFAGKKVVIYFYPKDMTPGCTQEGHDFTAKASDFKKLNTVVFGISRDTIASHEKFIKKENYTIDLLSDENETACRWFDVIKEKNMYGKKVLGIERSTFLIGEDGKVLQSWRKVKVDGHVAEVLEFIKKNS